MDREVILKQWTSYIPYRMVMNDLKLTGQYNDATGGNRDINCVQTNEISNLQITKVIVINFSTINQSFHKSKQISIYICTVQFNNPIILLG